MSLNWPPLDLHAHVSSEVPQQDLLSLKAVVFAATTSLDEFEATLGRSDPLVVWGVGVHPASSTSIASFREDRFARLTEQTPLVSEVGLDGRSHVKLEDQTAVLRHIMDSLAMRPRIVSVHSRNATRQIVDFLSSLEDLRGVVLHWWRGSPSETQAAVELGCWFSINESELATSRKAVVGLVPPERVLVETDHPYGDRRSKGRPGQVSALEDRLSREWGLHVSKFRELQWRNLSTLASETQTITLFPPRIRGMLSVASGSRH